MRRPFPGNLDVRSRAAHDRAQHDRQASHAFAADDANLNARLFRAIGDDGGKAGFDEIDMVDASFAGFKPTPHGKINGFEMRFEQSEIFARKARQNAV